MIVACPRPCYLAPVSGKQPSQKRLTTLPPSINPLLSSPRVRHLANCFNEVKLINRYTLVYCRGSSLRFIILLIVPCQVPPRFTAVSKHLNAATNCVWTCSSSVALRDTLKRKESRLHYASGKVGVRWMVRRWSLNGKKMIVGWQEGVRWLVRRRPKTFHPGD